MNKYDGPSFFRKDHPKVEPIQAKKEVKPKQPKYELPKNIRTQDDLKAEALQHMEHRKTPSPFIPNDPPPERYPFKNKYIPKSLQNLEGWQTDQIDTGLYATIQARLKKQADSYLLFEEHLSDEMKTKVDIISDQPRNTQTVARPDTISEKVAEIQVETAKQVMKPSTGLHRSLSNIMAEEQRGIQKSRDKLSSLFNEEENFKK